MRKKKLTYTSLALSTLKNRKKRYAIMLIGIILAMIFSSGVPFFVSCLHSSREEMQDRKLGKQTTIVTNAQNYELEKAVEDGSVIGEIGYAHILSYVWNEKEDFTDGTMIGWLDDRAAELYYPVVSEGRMPEKENEIAIEKGALQRMRLDTNIGEEITLKSLICNSSDFLDEETEVTYKLVGILYDKKSNFEQFSYNSVEKAQKLPAALVVKNSRVEIGGKEALVAFLNETWSSESYISSIPLDDQIDSNHLYANSITDGYTKLTNNLATVIFLSALLAFMSCFGIVNAFNSNLKERKKQIGMLKAVGATQKQLIAIFGREAFIICLFTAPLSVGIAFGGVKLFAKIMGESFVFKPNFIVLIGSAILSVACVMLSAIIPLFNISRLSPMQAVRNIEMMRKMKKQKVKSQESFIVSKHLAKRKLLFSKGKNVAISAVIACSVIISCLSVSLLDSVISYSYDYHNVDYKVRNSGGVSSANSFINDLSVRNTEPPLTENAKNEVLNVPQVADVYGEKGIKLNIVFQDEVPEYLQVNEYMCLGCSSRFLSASDAFYADSKGTNSVYVTPELTKETVKEYFQAAVNPDYTYTKDKAKLGKNEELLNFEITAISPELFVAKEITKDNLIAGDIDIEKLNSGEEVIIYAPERIGFDIQASSYGGFSSSIYNLSELAEYDATFNERLDEKNLEAVVESPFRVGDTLKLTLLCDDGSGNVTREDKTVKIGAIVGKKSLSGYFKMFTTLEGLDTFTTNFNYDTFEIELKEECTAQVDEIMQTELSSIFPGKDILSVFAVYEAERQEKRAWIISIASLMLVLVCVSISLINNSISAQIRDDKRTLGTLRAVGASEKELVSSYINQIAGIIFWGFVIGSLIYFCSYTFIGLVLMGEYFSAKIWPILMMAVVLCIACYINLKARIKTITVNSIVENIREL